jgi:3-phosphoshikimate 1-carboxyvinyltransferase
MHVPNAAFECYQDHRMAMALAPLAIPLGEVEISNPGVVKKSYPEFWNDLKAVGFEVIQQE